MICLLFRRVVKHRALRESLVDLSSLLVRAQLKDRGSLALFLSALPLYADAFKGLSERGHLQLEDFHEDDKPLFLGTNTLEEFRHYVIINVIKI